jgi:hypothetical protein
LTNHELVAEPNRRTQCGFIKCTNVYGNAARGSKRIKLTRYKSGERITLYGDGISIDYEQQRRQQQKQLSVIPFHAGSKFNRSVLLAAAKSFDRWYRSQVNR